MKKTIPSFIPVIHPISAHAAGYSTACAVENGADGIFLINQGMDLDDVLALSVALKEKNPDLWVGINLLGEPLETVLFYAFLYKLDGIWTDNAHIEENEQQQIVAQRFKDKIEPWEGLYFGGVAFKHQRKVAFNDLAKAASIAKDYMDVVTTSGPGTGIAADLEHVKEVRKGLGDHPMGIASGITPENIDQYLPYVDSFLVATGIEKEFGILDADKTAKVAEAIHSYQKEKAT